jgi:hypothetical protein
MEWVQRLPLLFPLARNKQKLVITTHNSSWSIMPRLELLINHGNFFKSQSDNDAVEA